MESVKKCVTTYLPNAVALKMDDAQTVHLYISKTASVASPQQLVVLSRNV